MGAEIQLETPAADQSEDRPFMIFRGAAARPLHMDEITGVTEVAAAGIRRVSEAGGNGSGADVRVLMEIPGFSLTYAWFKSGYPLPRHSHKMDCAYYIVSGSLQLGSAVLGKGDSFFVPANAPYTYVVGREGVEVLEFRHDACHDIHIMANNGAFWAKALEALPANRARWASELPPSLTLAEKAEPSES